MPLPVKPTDSELEILQLLWQDSPASVRQINEQLNADRSSEKSVGYTTTLKLMQIMTEKGLLRRDTSRRTHTYEPAIAERDTRSNLLRRFVDSTFRGSAAKLVLQALGDHRASADELAEIKALIHRIERERSEEE